MQEIFKIMYVDSVFKQFCFSTMLTKMLQENLLEKLNHMPLHGNLSPIIYQYIYINRLSSSQVWDNPRASITAGFEVLCGIS